MTREEAIAIARQCAKEFPEGYMNPANAEVFEPHPWVIHAILRASQPPKLPEHAAFEMAEEPHDVRDMVLEMREFFLTLVSGFNAVGAYEAAVSAQAIAVALNTFEAMRVLTGLSWPLEVIRAEGEPPGLKTTYENDNVRYGEDL